jgi:hypothetical protein
MNKSVKTLVIAAAVSGLLGGTAVRAHAAVAGNSGNGVKASATSVANAGVMRGGQDAPAKHSCKGKNDCKGQGGCKSSDNGCKAKNSCKGKGGCATDGSKMPKS